MERFARKAIIFILLMMIIMLPTSLTGCEKEDNNKKEILIGAAASLNTIMEEVKLLYQEQYPDITVNFTFAGSGSLEQQIRQGAPVDLFISAAMKQMDNLIMDGYILADTMVELLENQIVLIVPTKSKFGISSFEDIIKAQVIAVGDPDIVPAGKYAFEIFASMDILDEVNTKANYANDVTEVLAWVSSGNADAGVVYSTDAALSKEVTQIAYAPEGSHNRIVYPAAVVKDAKEETARAFLEFLTTEKVQKIFTEYGFKTLP
ncbi:molybdate ABC transporter substrate-binding protein [Mobilitalea sibirica]|uniref:Molybdate ABC transporter substrate-binding protein n=1 Tax=Mobilitalea sibirica TaxID=1462919 RepID=A0A8J7HD71_9FIRM|nr:molybdate ABC transporter substrate-binding protein [Mobilitalea sibirica]MBH1941722.1 molybdate ABC transporter substrate-binding protein [Mobilitalea sibirica]